LSDIAAEVLPVVKMIALQAVYQIALTLTLHFVGQERLAFLNGGQVASDKAFKSVHLAFDPSGP
jgi:hypothetical protein